MSVTEQMIDAVLARKHTIDIGGFLYGNRHVIRDHEEERKRQDTVVLWEMVTDDYEAGHAAATVQFERIYARKLLEAALSAAPIRAETMYSKFAACIEISEEAGVTSVHWEDCTYVASPVFDGAYHFMDRLEAIDDGRLVGFQVWCAKPPASEKPHPDELAVDRFATAMKEKLAQKRNEGRGGWDDKKRCSQEYLSKMLHDHARKQDPVDIANFAMMLHQRGEIVFQDQEFMALRDEAKGYALKMLLLKNDNARLREALEKISSPTQTTDLLWWQIEARTALADQKGGAA